MRDGEIAGHNDLLTPPRGIPPTARGRRTRAKLIESAREVFVRKGSLDTRIVDIIEAAGVAVGSFYTYFEDLDDILAAVLEQLSEEMLHASSAGVTNYEDPIATIEAANRSYLLAFQRNAPLMALMDEVFTVNPNFRQLRDKRRDAFIQRNTKAIMRMREDGLVDPLLNPELAAECLSSMVSRMARWAFIERPGTSFEDLVWNLTRLWANALRITSDPGHDIRTP